jgi:hypothetical protein
MFALLFGPQSQSFDPPSTLIVSPVIHRASYAWSGSAKGRYNETRGARKPAFKGFYRSYARSFVALLKKTL